MTSTSNNTDVVQSHDSSTGATTVDNIRIDLPMYQSSDIVNGSSEEMEKRT